MEFPANSPEQLGAILRGLRSELGLSQAEVAARVGLPQKAVSGAELHAGKMGVGRLFQLLSALGLELVVRRRSSGRASKAEW